MPGIFKVFWKDLHHRSSLFHKAPMPYSVFFDGGNAFHEDSVQVPSHGCVPFDSRSRSNFLQHPAHRRRGTDRALMPS
jgi:hypothetical protein